MQCKAVTQKIKRVKAQTEEQRKRLARKKEERRREVERRNLRNAFNWWSMYIREGVREC